MKRIQAIKTQAEYPFLQFSLKDLKSDFSPVILALDTSTEMCSVALLWKKEILSYYQLAPREHAQLILPMLNQLLVDAGVSLSQVDCLGFGAGPGSFTGVRLATSVTQGIAYARDLPIVPVSTLLTLSQGAYRIWGAMSILAALDARMQQIYFGIYQLDNNHLMQPIGIDRVIYPDQVNLPEGMSASIGVGEGWKTYQHVLAEKSAPFVTEIHAEVYPIAADIIPIAIKQYSDENVVYADRSSPIYLREDIV